MFCYNCGNKLLEGASLCDKCGAPVGAFAPQPPVQPQVPVQQEAPAAEPIDPAPVESVAEVPSEEPAAPVEPPVFQDPPAAEEEPPADRPVFIDPPAEAAYIPPAVPEIPVYIPPHNEPSPEEIAARKKGRAFSIVALIAGILSFLIGCIPALPLVIEIVGIIFAALGIRKDSKRAMAIIGLILSIVALLTTLVTSLLLIISLLEGNASASASYYYY